MSPLKSTVFMIIQWNALKNKISRSLKNKEQNI